MPKSSIIKAFTIIGVALVSLNTSAQTKTGLHILKKHAIKSSGGWDYITVDAAEKRSTYRTVRRLIF